MTYEDDGKHQKFMKISYSWVTHMGRDFGDDCTEYYTVCLTVFMIPFFAKSLNKHLKTLLKAEELILT